MLARTAALQGGPTEPTCHHRRGWPSGISDDTYPGFFLSIFYDYRRPRAPESFNNTKSKQEPMITLLGVGSLSLLTRKGWAGRQHGSLAERRQLLWRKAVALGLAQLRAPCDQVGTALRRARVHLGQSETKHIRVPRISTGMHSLTKEQRLHLWNVFLSSFWWQAFYFIFLCRFYLFIFNWGTVALRQAF